MPYTYQELRAENERLKEEAMRLKRELDQLRGGEETEAGEPRVIYVAGRRKGSGAHYDVGRLNYQHRKILYTLIKMGATSLESGVPAVQIRRETRIGQGPLSGRLAEIIRKNFVSCNKVRVLFQLDAERSWRFRPESAYDPNIGAKRYMRFVYWITEAGKRELKETVTTADDFVKADIGILIELKKVAEAREGAKA